MAPLPVTLRLKSVDKSRLRITLEANQECEYEKVTQIFFCSYLNYSDKANLIFKTSSVIKSN